MLRRRLFAHGILLASLFTMGLPALGQEDEPVAGQAEPAVVDQEQPGSTHPLAAALEGINHGAEFIVVRFLQPTLFMGVPTGVTELERFGTAGEAQQEVPKSIPLILLVLIAGGVFFTIRFRLINLRLFRHAIDVIAGKYDKHGDTGEVTHFQALTSALSATVGLGNIASVAVAISLGGAGAVFWMWLVGFFGMCSKFSSCTLGQLYRRVKPDGTVLGGPMIYLSDGLAGIGPQWKVPGKVLAFFYAIFTMFAAFGGGNMFQGNQTFGMLSSQFDVIDSNNSIHRLLVGVLLGVMVSAVIIGGIKRIGQVTSKLVPVMCVTYCVFCLIIVVTNIALVPDVFASIFQQAFSPRAAYGGMVGVLILGARRAAFSNEAGMGSAAIAHAAAKTDEPVREGIVAMVGPFIDTIVVCTMTAMAILVTKSHLDPAGEVLPFDEARTRGVEVTAAAFANLGTFLPYFLCLAVFVFAYSTMISWSYYGERAVEYLVGVGGIPFYRIVYILFVVLGPILSLQAVIDFSDMMLISMAFPNIIGSIILSGLVASKLKDYVDRLKSGEMKPEQ